MTKKILPLSKLTALSPLDGRYRKDIEELVPFFSEYSLIKMRIHTEVEYLLFLSANKIIRKLTPSEKKILRDIQVDFSLKHAELVKEVEKETRHDVKAMEKVFRKLIKDTSIEDITEMIHFGLTSEDINNLSQRLLIKQALDEYLINAIKDLIKEIAKIASENKNLPMLARTHGQAAVPTTLGKELVVFAMRLLSEFRNLKQIQLTGKLNGAVGNFNALAFAHPQADWIALSNKFIVFLGLNPNLYTTQINTYEDLAMLFQTFQRINTILIDFNQDMWRYISDGYFMQQVKKGEVGSSTMPQKVNPIDFEKSEGNLEVANALFELYCRNLPISRLQRDLTDSTVTRTIGIAFGHSVIGYKSMLTGLSRVQVNEKVVREELQKDWTILSEAAQTLLRAKGVADPYSLFKNITRGKEIGKKEWNEIINGLSIDTKTKDLLKNLTPESYIGLSVKLVEKALKEITSTL